MLTKEIKISIRSDVNQVSMVGRALSSLILDSGLSEKRIALFELAVVEAVTNVIEHAYEYDAGFSVELVLRLAPEFITVEITDFGRPMAASVVESYTGSPPSMDTQVTDIMSLPESGWGTSLVATLCDRVCYTHHRTSNILTLTCNLDAPVEQVG